MNTVNDKTQGDIAVQNFKNALKGLDLEEKMKPKWIAMSMTSTQKRSCTTRLSVNRYSF